MKCREFEAMVVDLARERGLDEAARSRAIAHAETCLKCAHRLELERELTEALHTLAASEASPHAPPEEEAALLAAFDRRQEAKAAHNHAAARWTWAFASIAAAAIVGVTAIWFLRAPQLAPTKVVAVHVPEPVVASVPAPASRVMPPSRQLRAAAHRAQPRQRKNAPETRHKPAGKFYPLLPMPSNEGLKGAPIVRVEMPAIVLASYGWRLSPEQVTSRVRADIVLDADTGMARAIRFVNDWR